MTCVVGLVDNGRVVMGADSAGVGGYDLRVRADEKVFRNGPFLMGFTSSFRMGQLLRYDLEVDPQGGFGIADDHEYLVRHFITRVRDTLTRGGYATKDKEAEAGGRFLLGYRGRLYEVQEDYQVAAYHEPYAACGCGADFALGALAGVRDMAHSSVSPPAAHRQVELALEVAERFSAGVRRPFVLKALDPPGPPG